MVRIATVAQGNIDIMVRIATVAQGNIDIMVRIATVAQLGLYKNQSVTSYCDRLCGPLFTYTYTYYHVRVTLCVAQHCPLIRN